MIDSNAGKMSFYVTEIDWERLNFFIDFIDCEDLNSTFKNCYHFTIIVVKEYDFMNDLFIWRSVKTFSWFYIPNYKHVSEIIL